MRIVRTNTYQRGLKRLAKFGVGVTDVAAMEAAIASNPTAGDVIPGTRGLRKMRFGYGRVGKRGGGRTIYYLFGDAAIFMIAVYTKTDKGDLTTNEKRLFMALIDELEEGIER